MFSQRNQTLKKHLNNPNFRLMMWMFTSIKMQCQAETLLNAKPQSVPLDLARMELSVPNTKTTDPGSATVHPASPGPYVKGQSVTRILVDMEALVLDQALGLVSYACALWAGVVRYVKMSWISRNLP